MDLQGGVPPGRVCQLSFDQSNHICLTSSRSGSMADIPQNLLEQIKELERLFTVDKAQLKKITEHFVDELAKGV